MNRRDWGILLLGVLGLIAGLIIGYALWNDTGSDANTGTTRTETVTVEKTVPGPEKTVETTVVKRKPGVTTWIIVCGERTEKVTGGKPNAECKGTLPNTGP